MKSTRELKRDGFGRAELGRMVRDGRLERVRRGIYDQPAKLDLRANHRRLLRATLGCCSEDAVVSHISAALLHALPTPHRLLSQVHITRPRAGGGRSSKVLQVHGLALDPADVVQVEGYAVTSPARTVVDLACSLSTADAVAIGDAALRAGSTPSEVLAALERAGRRVGLPAARRAVALLDGRSESPGESHSRVLLHEHGVPAPELQFEVLGPHGLLVGRTDFSWPELRTLGEFDGRVKYGRDLSPDGDLEQVLFDEKRREDALRDLGWEIVRWVWSDLRDPAALLERLERAFARGKKR